MIRVEVHLVDQSQPIVRDDVLNAYSKGGFYCLFRQGGTVEKYPIPSIWRVTEQYGDTA
jgi:hypothetical protein